MLSVNGVKLYTIDIHITYNTDNTQSIKSVIFYT